MKTILAAVVLGLLAATRVYAQEGPTPQQVRMSECNAQANKNKIMGERRKSFVSQCLKGGDPAKIIAQPAKPGAQPAKSTAQQAKMKSCNKEAADQKLKGAERKKFVNQCLRA
jgi:hypothetical protein